MRLLGRFEVIEPYPAVYIKELSTIVIADLHLGYEGIMAEKGVFLPKVQFRKEMEMMKGVLQRKKADRIVLNGDVKHEFSETSYHEFREVADFLSFLRENFDEVVAVKGNHDNYLARLTGKLGVRLCTELQLDDLLVLHGHLMPAKLPAATSCLVMAHEHPSIALYDEIGVKEKLSCFLYGEMLDGRGILVLPPFSYFAQGYDLNIIPKQELLSPILRSLVDVDELSVLGIEEETGCMRFPTLGTLRRLSER